MSVTTAKFGRRFLGVFRARLALLAIIFCLILGCGLIYILQTQTAAGNVAAQHYDQYAELYFAEPNGLPQKLRGHQNVSIGFVITNHTGGTRTYTYQVTLLENNVLKSSYQKSLTLTNGQAAEQTAQVRTISDRTEKIIKIDLVGTTQSIQTRSDPWAK